LLTWVYSTNITRNAMHAETRAQHKLASIAHLHDPDLVQSTQLLVSLQNLHDQLLLLIGELCQVGGRTRHSRNTAWTTAPRYGHLTHPCGQ
jgi:hypothetical protein